MGLNVRGQQQGKRIKADSTTSEIQPPVKASAQDHRVINF